MKKNSTIYLYCFVFLIALLIYAIFSTKTGIHDTGEYIVKAKDLAGLGNIEPYTFHSIIYSLFLSFFLRIFPSLITIKIINILWIFATGLLLYFYTKNKKTLLLWITSPLIWFVGIEITPMLPLAFFFLLSYILFKKWENDGKKSSVMLSGFFLGFSLALWTGALILVLVFMLIFFWNKTFKQVLTLSILFILGLSTQFLVDAIFLGFPLYTLIRYFGGNLYYLIYGISQKPTFLLLLRILFFIAPLAFLLYKTNLKKYKRELIFILFMILIFYFRGRNPDGLKLFITFAPFMILLLGKVISKKLLFLNTIIATLLVIFLILPPYFNQQSTDVLIKQDLAQIQKDFHFKKVIAGKDQELLFATLSWSKEPYFIWFDEYELYKENETVYQQYSYPLPEKEHRIMEIGVTFKPKKLQEDYENLPLILRKDQEAPPEFKLVKEYKILNVYLPR